VGRVGTGKEITVLRGHEAGASSAELPELGSLDRRPIAALVGLATLDPPVWTMARQELHRRPKEPAARRDVTRPVGTLVSRFRKDSNLFLLLAGNSALLSARHRHVWTI
jgi:hypothetical protein